MNAALRLHAQAQANERSPYAQKVDPAYWTRDDQPLPFSADWADGWICGLADAEDAQAYIDKSGITLGDQAHELAPLFQAMAQAYRDKPAAIADLTSGRFFRAMKSLAAVAYNNQ
jgi:hypothetical protein